MKKNRICVSICLIMVMILMMTLPAVGAREIYDLAETTVAGNNTIVSATLYDSGIEVCAESNEPAQIVAACFSSENGELECFGTSYFGRGEKTVRIDMNLSSASADSVKKVIMLNAVTLRALCDVYTLGGMPHAEPVEERAESCTVVFVVKDENGAPVSGAELTAVKDGGNESVEFSAPSDANGIACARLADGDYTVTAVKSGLTRSSIKVTADGSAKASVIIMKGDNGYVEYKRYIYSYQWYNDAGNNITEGVCGENLTWSYDKQTNKLSINGSGDMNDFEDVAPWAEFSDEMKSIEIANGVTGIGKNAFKNSTALAQFDIGANITRIGDEAFFGCVNLKSIVNDSALNIVKGSTTNGYVAYYAHDIYVSSVTSDDGYSPIYKSVKPAIAKGSGGETTRTYTGLTPGENYIVYAVNSTDGDIFTSENISYINQKKADNDGTAAFTSAVFGNADKKIFLMGTSTVDISQAEVKVPVVVADGSMHLAAPVVTYDGATLKFGEDYYLTGDCLQSSSGTYEFEISGIGRFGSSVKRTFTIVDSNGRVYKTGNIFLGWYDGEDEDAEPYLPDFTAGTDVYAYPHWEDIDNVTVDSEDIYKAYGEDYTSAAGFNLLGAQIRYNESDNLNGLRFVSRIGKRIISKLESLDGNLNNRSASFGHYIKARMSENGVLDKTNGTKSQADNILYEGREYYTFSAVIYNIPDSGCNTEIAVRPYIEYIDANGTEQTYYFNETVARNYNGAYHTTIARVAKFIVEHDTERLNNSLPGLQAYIRHLAELCNDN